ncbi:hypothetical protein ACHAWT_002091 [Skeletonema menzelii]
MQDPAHDEGEHSLCDDSSGNYLLKQPQHSNLIHQVNVSVASSASAEANTSDLKESMNLKKRSSSGLPTHSATFTTHIADATIENGSTSATLPSIPVAKRKRVTFASSTKEPSTDHNLSTNPLGPRKLENQLPTSIMNQSRSCTALPGLVSVENDSVLTPTNELDLNVSPSTFVRTILLQSKSLTNSIRGEDIIAVATTRLNDDSYFLTYTDEQTEAYNNEKVYAVQGNDVETLRAFHQAGEIMQTSNRFGESLLHTSCRRGFTDIVRFFINEAGVSPRVRDDMGRTPMHDACWSSSPPNHEIMRILITSAPEMLLSKDKRGHSPFDYARREYWPQWVQFLNEHRQLIVNCLLASFMESPENVFTVDDSDTSRSTPTDEMAHVWQS